MGSEWPVFIEFARDLRKKQTKEEKIMWSLLRNRKFMGFKFLRQHPILVPTFEKIKSFYIADFYCHEKRFVLEIDGLIHLFRIAEDIARDHVMNRMGLKILRITNEMVDKEIENVLKMIKHSLGH
jgi:very-short-patch-repair endonuclease